MSGRAEVHRLKTRLDAAFARAPDPTADLELQADFAKYLCVLVSGYLESCLCALLLGYAKGKCSPEVLSYVERQLGPWTSPTSGKIVALIGAFSQVWERALTAYLVDERKDSVNSLVALRHKIAHGESVGTSLSQVRKHYAVANGIVSFVENLVDP